MTDLETTRGFYSLMTGPVKDNSEDGNYIRELMLTHIPVAVQALVVELFRMEQSRRQRIAEFNRAVAAAVTDVANPVLVLHSVQ